MGENGAGKSTLIKVLTGAIRRDEGEIRLDGRPVEISTPAQSRTLGIGTVYQEVNLIPTDVGDEEPDAQPSAATFRGGFVARGARARQGAPAAAQHRHRHRAAARLLFRCDPATRRHRPRARRRHHGPGSRRADRQPRRQRDGDAVPDRARPQGARHRDRLHYPFHRPGLPDRRSHLGAAQRPPGRQRQDRRYAAAEADLDDDRARARKDRD